MVNHNRSSCGVDVLPSLAGPRRSPPLRFSPSRSKGLAGTHAILARPMSPSNSRWAMLYTSASSPLSSFHLPSLVIALSTCDREEMARGEDGRQGRLLTTKEGGEGRRLQPQNRLIQAHAHAHAKAQVARAHGHKLLNEMSQKLECQVVGILLSQNAPEPKVFGVPALSGQSYVRREKVLLARAEDLPDGPMGACGVRRTIAHPSNVDFAIF